LSLLSLCLAWSSPGRRLPASLTRWLTTPASRPPPTSSQFPVSPLLLAFSPPPPPPVTCLDPCLQPPPAHPRSCSCSCSYEPRTHHVAMDERESSVASSSDLYESDTKPKTPVRLAPPDPSVAKRKAPHFPSVPDKKKRKLDSSASASPAPAAAPAPSTELRSCARLPPPVWQRVFLFCSLADLGRLIQVNRAFHSYLTAVPTLPSHAPSSGCLRLLKSESLWASARNAFPSKPPKPLPGFSELRMMQLVWSGRCQFCAKPNAFTPGDAFWEQGPGPAGVRAVWPFGIKSCGPCLQQRCQSVSCDCAFPRHNII
jgi:hypothetical protein